MMLKFKHENVIRVRAVFQNQKNLYIVMDPRTNCLSHFYGTCSFLEIAEVGLKVFKALKPMHDSGVAHLDMKGDNVMLNMKTDDNGRQVPDYDSLALIDFDTAQVTRTECDKCPA